VNVVEKYITVELSRSSCQKSFFLEETSTAAAADCIKRISNITFPPSMSAAVVMAAHLVTKKSGTVG